MSLGERIKACRQQAGLSQENVAEAVGVSRQAVTKWETGQSAPSTENLFRLAELFGTTADLLLTAPAGPPLAEQLFTLYQAERAQRVAVRRAARIRNIRAALWTLAGYRVVYLICKLLWGAREQSSLLGWLLGTGSTAYLFGWLLTSRLFWAAMAVSAIPALFGKRRFAAVTLAAFALGIPLGEQLGPCPAGIPYGHSHYGWAIWGGIFLVSAAVGIIWEKWPKNPA